MKQNLDIFVEIQFELKYGDGFVCVCVWVCVCVCVCVGGGIEFWLAFLDQFFPEVLPRNR